MMGALLISGFPSLSFYYFFSAMGACFFLHKGTRGWVARIYQLRERSPPRSWLPIVEAPGTQPPFCEAVVQVKHLPSRVYVIS